MVSASVRKRVSLSSAARRASFSAARHAAPSRESRSRASTLAASTSSPSCWIAVSPSRGSVSMTHNEPSGMPSSDTKGAPA